MSLTILNTKEIYSLTGCSHVKSSFSQAQKRLYFIFGEAVKVVR